MKELILGGRRSGKSRLVEARAAHRPDPAHQTAGALVELTELAALLAML